jgi:alpha-N-arabinofuranosidase
MQWRTDLIGYDALTSYGSPSYYAQVMFSSRHGDNVLATDSQNIPSYDWNIPARRRNGVDQPASVRQVPSLFFDATRASAGGTIYLKVVNRAAAPQPVEVKITGVASVEPKGLATVLRADKPDATNSLTDPKHIVPVTSKVKDLSADFTREFPAYSITVLELQAK